MKWSPPAEIRRRTTAAVTLLGACTMVLILTDHDFWAIAFATATVACFIGGAKAMEESRASVNRE